MAGDAGIKFKLLRPEFQEWRGRWGVRWRWFWWRNVGEEEVLWRVKDELYSLRISIFIFLLEILYRILLSECKRKALHRSVSPCVTLGTVGEQCIYSLHSSRRKRTSGNSLGNEDCKKNNVLTHIHHHHSLPYTVHTYHSIHKLLLHGMWYKAHPSIQCFLLSRPVGWQTIKGVPRSQPLPPVKCSET